MRKELEKAKNQLRFNEKFGKCIERLNELLDVQRVSCNREGLGLEAEPSSTVEIKGKKSITFVQEKKLEVAAKIDATHQQKDKGSTQSRQIKCCKI